MTLGERRKAPWGLELGAKPQLCPILARLISCHAALVLGDLRRSLSLRYETRGKLVLCAGLERLARREVGRTNQM